MVSSGSRRSDVCHVTQHVCVAVCCSAFQCVAVHCCLLQCSGKRARAVCVLQCVVVCCSVLQSVAFCCTVLQCAAV